MAQFTPSKKTIKDFNDGEEYLNRIDVVQADTVNNLVEGLLYAQENGGGTTMLTEGREFGKELKDNDYFLDVIGSANTISYSSASTMAINNPILVASAFEEIALSPPQDIEKEISLSGLQEEQIELTSVSDDASGISLTYQDEIN